MIMFTKLTINDYIMLYRETNLHKRYTLMTCAKQRTKKLNKKLPRITAYKKQTANTKNIECSWLHKVSFTRPCFIYYRAMISMLMQRKKRLLPAVSAPPQIFENLGLSLLTTSLVSLTTYLSRSCPTFVRNPKHRVRSSKRATKNLAASLVLVVICWSSHGTLH